MKLKAKIRKTNKAVQSFIKSCIKNYQSMKKKLSTIWAIMALVIICSIQQGCNVTRTITNESRYFQKGDTSVVIQTKTIESYNAEKKGI